MNDNTFMNHKHTKKQIYFLQIIPIISENHRYITGTAQMANRLEVLHENIFFCIVIVWLCHFRGKSTAPPIQLNIVLFSSSPLHCISIENAALQNVSFDWPLQVNMKYCTFRMQSWPKNCFCVILSKKRNCQKM